MAQQTGFVEESYDRVQNAFQSVTDEFEKLQANVERRRKRFDKETQRRMKRFRKELDKNPLVKRATGLQRDAEKQFRKARKNITKEVERRVEEMLGTMQIASQGDLKKLDRKLGKIAKQLREIEKTRSGSEAKSEKATPKAASA